MSRDFYKYPSTPHLAVLDNVVVRNDKVLDPEKRDNFLKADLIVEEKVDGANLGISFDESGNLRCQNRGNYLYHPYMGQWKKLPEWLASRTDTLFDNLGDRYILFGEWCYAQHSVFYDKLPDWFLSFDLYDKEKSEFLSYSKRNTFCKKLGLYEVPVLKCGHFTLPELQNMLSVSVLGSRQAEGIYMRYDEGSWLGSRAKLVRPQFIQSQEVHWSKKELRVNSLRETSTASEGMVRGKHS
jgi:ATP-dependent RNA circularization protein (DNA/RNA ligase family)